MHILPIQRRMTGSQIFIALAVGTIATVYVWTPIIKEQSQKAKQQSQAATDSPQITTTVAATTETPKK